MPRPVLWATALLLFAPLAFGVTPRDDSLELPEVVVRGIDQVRLEAQRAGQPPLEPARSAQAALPVDLPTAELPAAELRPAPPVTSPGCAYRNPVTGALARAGGDPVAYFKTGMDRLAHDELDQAAFFFSAVREKHPDHPLADSAAFHLAEIHRRQGKSAEAIAFYRLVKGEFARQAAYRLAWLLDAEGRTEEALSAWHRVTQDPGSPFLAEAWFRIGVAELSRGDPAAAATSLESALELAAAEHGETTAGTLYALGLAQRQLGALETAEKNLLRFLLEFPDRPAAGAAQTALGWVLLDRGQPAEAAHRFSWVLAQATDPALVSRALYGRVRAFVDLEDPSRAARALDALEAEVPTGPWVGWARSDLAWMAFRSGDFESALENYRSALRVWDGPGEDAPRYMVAECLYLLGRYPEADAGYRQVAQTSPLRSTALHRAGLCKLLADDPAGAETVLRQLLDQFPGYPQSDRVWAWLGEALFRQGHADEAARAFRTVSSGSPAYPQALYGLAWLAFEAERWDESADLFTSFLRLAPGDPNRDEALLTLAQAHFNRRQPLAALESLDLLESSSTDPNQQMAARYYRGWMLTRSGQEAAGRAALAALLQEAPAGPFAARAHRTLAWLDYGQGEYEAALEHFNAVLALSTDAETATEARTKRADCLFNLGRYREALDAYQQLGETPEAAYGAALCLQNLGELQRLAAAAEQFAERYPDDPRAADLFLALGRLHAEAGDPSSAALAYARAAQASGDETRAAEAHLEAARSLQSAGRTDAALEMLTRLARRDDAVGTAALQQQALVLEQIGDPPSARAAWVRYADRVTAEPRATALREAARWARATSSWEEAEALLAQALEACPQDTPLLKQSVLTDLGETLLMAGNPDRAVAVLSEAGEMGRSDEGLRALSSLGRAQQAAGAPENALDTYLRLGYLYPLSSPEVAAALLRAGAILEELGDTERARQLYQKLAEEAPPEWAERARGRLPQGARP